VAKKPRCLGTVLSTPVSMSVSAPGKSSLSPRGARISLGPSQATRLWAARLQPPGSRPSGPGGFRERARIASDFGRPPLPPAVAVEWAGRFDSPPSRYLAIYT
jgi:hypothetical protein